MADAHTNINLNLEKVEDDKGAKAGQELLPPITNLGDNQIALALQAKQGTESPGECQPIQLVGDQPSLKVAAFDKQNRPTVIVAKAAGEEGETTFSEIEYNGASNEASSLRIVMKVKDLNGEVTWDTKVEKNKEGSWNVYDKKDGQWTLAERKRDFGQLTISQDAKTKEWEIHGTGSDINRLGTFAKDDGFMSEQAFQNGDLVTKKVAASRAAIELNQADLSEPNPSKERLAELVKDASEHKYSKEQIADILAKEEATAKLPALNNEGVDTNQARILAAGYKQIIADFDKIAKGGKEITSGDLARYADEQRDGAIAQTIASSISKYGRVTYPNELLIAKLLDGTTLLRLKSEVGKVETGINSQLKTIAGPNSNYSAEFGRTLLDAKFAPDEPVAAFASPEKDRLLSFYNNGKPAGQMRLRQRTDISYEGIDKDDDPPQK